MSGRKRTGAIEIIWLLFSLIVTLVISASLFKGTILKSSIDIHLHDTYFVVSTPTIVLPLFLLINFLLFFLKETRTKFSRGLPNTIILLSGLLLIIFMLIINKELIRSGMTAGWTSYPPLSSLPESKPVTPETDRVVSVVINSLMLSQFMLVVALLVVAFLWGTSWRRKGPKIVA